MVPVGWLVGLQSESEGKGAVDDIDGSHEQEHVEPHQIVPADALGSPGTVVVEPLDADIAVGAVHRFGGNVKLALPAETTFNLHYMVFPCLGLFCCEGGLAIPGLLRATIRYDRLWPTQTIFVMACSQGFWLFPSM